jgi:tetratricopeptide (TPR) repeat protein
MRREDYDFETELANSVSAIVNEGIDQYNADVSDATATITFENLDEEDELDLDDLTEAHKERRYPKTPKKNTVSKRKKSSSLPIVLAAAAFVVVVSAVVILFYSLSQNAQKDTYTYQANMAVTQYKNKNYQNAISYFEKALTYYGEADQISIRYYLYLCEKASGNEEKGIERLEGLLSYDQYNTTAIRAIADYYYTKGDSQKLNDLISKYMDTDAESAVSSFVNTKPGVSHCSGSYTTSIEVKLFNQSGNEIHYTLDGTVPNAKDSLYTQPIKMEKGTTQLKAVSVSADGLVSDVLECEYTISYAVPEKPIVRPGSGSYEDEQMIIIDNFVNDGSYTAHYTLDGSVPTKDSPIYTGPIDMPGGNNVFSVIFLSKDGITSDIVKRNYNLKLSARYTFDDALEILKEKMQEKGEISADAAATASGQAIRFVYYRKQSIGDKDMYLVYFDIKKSGTFERQNYLYGVDMVTGKCYLVTNTDGTFRSDEYK